MSGAHQGSMHVPPPACGVPLSSWMLKAESPDMVRDRTVRIRHLVVLRGCCIAAMMVFLSCTDPQKPDAGLAVPPDAGDVTSDLGAADSTLAPGTCQFPFCDDGSVCTQDGCTGSGCIHVPVDCADADPCTFDSCHPTAGCNHKPLVEGAICAKDACVEGKHVAASICQAGVCIKGGSLDCDDGLSCTHDVCAPSTGCSHAAELGMRMLSSSAQGHAARLAMLDGVLVAFHGSSDLPTSGATTRGTELDSLGSPAKSWPVDLKAGPNDIDLIVHAIDAVGSVLVVAQRQSLGTGVVIARVGPGGGTLDTTTWPKTNASDCASSDGSYGLVLCGESASVSVCRRYDAALDVAWTIDTASWVGAVAQDPSNGHVVIGIGGSGLRRVKSATGATVVEGIASAVAYPHGITVTEAGVTVVVGRTKDMATAVAAVDAGGKALWTTQLAIGPSPQGSPGPIAIENLGGDGFALAFGTEGTAPQLSTVRLDAKGWLVQQNVRPLQFVPDQPLDLHILGKRWTIGTHLVASGTGNYSSSIVLRCDAWGNCSCFDSGNCVTLPPAGCTDGNPCTTDQCDAGGCKHGIVPHLTPCGAAGQVCKGSTCHPLP